MIDEDRTIQLFGYTSNNLSYGSDKPIVRVCENCGRYKIVRKNAYHELCRICSQRKRRKDPEDRKVMIKYWSYQENRDIQSKKLIQYYKDHPEKGECHSEWLIQYFKDNPEIGKNHSLKLIKLYKDNPEISKNISKSLIQWYNNNPERIKEMSERLIQYYIDNPEERKRRSAEKQGQDYDKGEWVGFTDKRRPHLIPFKQCVHLNSTFEGCNQHHIMTGVIINIPIDLHKSIYHIMKTKHNMKEINELAFQYLLNGI